MTARTFKHCGCGRSYTLPEWLALASIGRMEDGLGGHIVLRNCTACDSTLSVDEDVEAHEVAGARIDAAAPWVRRLTAVVVEETEVA